MHWKTENMASIFRKSNISVAGNYRTVSLTFMPCRILKLLIRDKKFTVHRTPTWNYQTLIMPEEPFRNTEDQGYRRGL